MQTLVELDAVKQRMLESQRALKEADNWTTLLTDVEEVFASQDIDKVSQTSQLCMTQSTEYMYIDSCENTCIGHIHCT